MSLFKMLNRFCSTILFGVILLFPFASKAQTVCIESRRVLTGEVPKSLLIRFISSSDSTCHLTVATIHMGAGNSLSRTSGITCQPSLNLWSGEGTSDVAIAFNPPLTMGQDYEACIADNLGFYWNSGQTIDASFSCGGGPLNISSAYDDFFDIVTTKTYKISEAQSTGCPRAKTDVWLKDCPADNGAVPSRCSQWWKSPDIWIDNNGSQQIRPGKINVLKARVRNRGTLAASNTSVKFFYWDASHPNHGDITTVGTLIAATTKDVPLQGTIVSVSWVPQFLPQAWCLGVVLDHPADHRITPSVLPSRDNNFAVQCTGPQPARRIVTVP